MCNLCGNDQENGQAIKELENQVVRLRQLASELEGLAEGRITPHSEAAKMIGARARNAIRYLVDEWM